MGSRSLRCVSSVKDSLFNRFEGSLLGRLRHAMLVNGLSKLGRKVHYASCRTLEQQGREDDEGKGWRLALARDRTGWDFCSKSGGVNLLCTMLVVGL
jgi:hypothetical protein